MNFFTQAAHTPDFVLCLDVTWRCDYIINDRSVVITHSGPEGTAADKVMIDCLYFVCVCVCVSDCIGLHIYLQVCINVCVSDLIIHYGYI